MMDIYDDIIKKNDDLRAQKYNSHWNNYEIPKATISLKNVEPDSDSSCTSESNESDSESNNK
jgi:hypothetical protein